MCQIISYLLNINLRIPSSDFSEKSAFESGLLFYRDIAFLSNLSFSLVFRRTLFPECAYRPWDHFIFGNKMQKNQHMVKHELNLGFGFCLSFPFLCSCFLQSFQNRQSFVRNHQHHFSKGSRLPHNRLVLFCFIFHL